MRIVFLLFAVILPTSVFASDPLTQSEKDHFSALGQQVLQRVQGYYGQADLLKNVNIATLPMEADKNAGYHNEEVELGGFRDTILIDFDRSSSRLTSFFNVALSNQPNPELGQPPKKIWNKEQVQAKAERFVIAVLGKMPEEACKEAVVEFTPQVLFARDGSKRYRLGTWRVVWYRQNKQGVKFQYDTIIVQMIDGEEPLGLGYNFWSSYQDSDAQPIPAEKAMALAKEQAQKIMAWRPGAMWLQDFKLLDQPKSELQIVNPNHLLSQSQVTGERDATARLAWVVTYPKIYTGTKGANGAAPPGGYIEVWIDAETGEFLGGTFL